MWAHVCSPCSLTGAGGSERSQAVPSATHPAQPGVLGHLDSAERAPCCWPAAGHRVGPEAASGSSQPGPLATGWMRVR